MKILYISALSSRRLIESLRQESGEDPGYAVQKFNRLIALGLKSNDVDVKVLSAIPVNPNRNKKRFWKSSGEVEDGLEYNYIPFVNVKIFRQICIFFYGFFYVLIWGIIGRKDKAIVCDALSVSICYGFLLATKLNGIRSVGILTDMPGLMVSESGRSFATSFNLHILSLFSHYVFLTEAMNSVVNKKKKPYIIIEGVVDVLSCIGDRFMKKDNPRVVMYAGSLYERYGLKLLVDSFIYLKPDNAKLVIYGSGPYEDTLKSLSSDIIEYRGLRTTEEIVEAEHRATLLVNPRPTTEEFTKYSFPSKNMEYMVSGTPLLTTKLPGIPKDYYPYVYMFEEETVEGFSLKLSEILSLSEQELTEKGMDALEFVLNNKNNHIQTHRILNLLQQ